MRYSAIPLADRGFVPTDPIMNPVRWYVEDANKPYRLSGPYKSHEDADAAADEFNRTERAE